MDHWNHPNLKKIGCGGDKKEEENVRMSFVRIILLVENVPL